MLNTKQLYYRGGVEIPSLQILKLICSIFVIQIHVPSGLSWLIVPFCRVAVPIFFMISGYFLLSNDGYIESTKIKRTLLKIIRIAIPIQILYMLYHLCICIYVHPEKLGEMFIDPYSWVRLVLFGDQFCGALWYLNAYIYSLCILLIIPKRWRINVLVAFVPIGLIINLILGKYSMLLPLWDYSDLNVSRNVFTIGLPCLAIGILIRLYEYRFRNMRKLMLVLFMVILVSFVEIWWIYKIEAGSTGDIMISTIPLACIIMFVTLRIPLEQKWSNFVRFCKNYNLPIYLYHMLIYFLTLGFAPSYERFHLIIVILGTLIFCATINAIKQKYHFKILSYI